jgi:hypothetical protein
VDGLRIIVLSAAPAATMSQTSLEQTARMSGLVRWDLPFDAAIMALVGVLLAALAAVRFNRAENQ